MRYKLLVAGLVGVTLALSSWAATSLAAHQSRAIFRHMMPDGMTFVVADAVGKDHTFVLEDHAPVLIDDRMAKLRDLRPGDRVQVVWSERAGRKTAGAVLCRRG